MPRQKKVSFNQKLASYDVLIEDTSINSEYFKVSQFPEGFTGGKNGFLLAGTPFLVPNSRILVEVVNLENETIYYESVKNYTEGNSKLISFEIYENTPPGLYKVILLGQIRNFSNGISIPSSWSDKYNIRWTRDVIVEPRRRNVSPIRFKETPRIFIEQEKIIYTPSSSYITEVDSTVNIDLSPRYKSTLNDGYTITLISGSKFTDKYLDGVVTGSITASVNGNTYTTAVNLPLHKITNDTHAETTSSLITLDKIVDTFLLKSGSYQYTSAQTGQLYEVTSSVGIQYSYVLLDEDTILDTGSYSKLRIVNLGTNTGEVYKTEISYKVAGTTAEYVVTSTPNVSVPELLITASNIGDEYWVGTFVSGGVHSGAHLTETNWYSISMPAYTGDGDYQVTSLQLPLRYYTSSFFTPSLNPLVLDSTNIMNGIYANIPSAGSSTISPYLVGTKDSYTLFASSEYTLRFTALFSAYSGSTLLDNYENSQLYVYLASSQDARIVNNNPLGQLLTKLTINPNTQKQYFENVIVNFNPQVVDFGKVSLRFIATNGIWQFSNISIKPAEEFAFNPDETVILVPNYIDEKTINYKARFLDINGNSTKLEIESSPITFEGPRKYVKRSGDTMYGELYIDDVAIKQQSLESSFTGLLSGGVITINSLDNTKYDITAGYGYVVDNYTNTLDPTYKLVSWSRFEAITPSGLGINPRTNIAISSSGQIYEQPLMFNDRDYREYIVLGRVVHIGTPNIQRTLSLPFTVYNRHFHWFDLASAISPLNVAGNVYGPSGSSMNMSKTAGETYRIGSNYRTDPTFPDITTDTAVNTVTLAYRWRSGSGFAEAPATTIVTGSLYDDGTGTLASVANNKVTTQRIYFFGATNTTRIQFGQTLHNTVEEAISLANSELFEVDPNLSSDATLRAFLILKGDVTDLSVNTHAVFIPVSQFGTGGGAGGGGVSSLSALTDVELTSVINNDVLTYSSASAAWVNRPVFPYSGSIIITGSVTASAFTGSLSYNFLTNLPTLVSSSGQVIALLPNGTVSASSQVAHNSTTGYVANEHINHTAVSITAGSGLTGGGDISATRTLTLDTGSVHFVSGSIINVLNPKAVISSSAQVAHNSTTGYVANEHINHTSVSITAGSGLTGGGDISATRTLTLDTSSLHFTGGVTTRINALGVFSSSGQVAHNSTTGYVANEHINHTSVSLTAGSGLSGGGDISATRTITLDTGSTHFQNGVLTRINTAGVYSSSAQLVVSAYTNATDNRVLTSTGAGGINAEANLTFDGNIFAINTNQLYVSGGNVGIGTTSPTSKLEVNGAIRTGADVASVSLYTNTGWRHTGASGLYIDANSGGAANSVFIRNGSGFATQLTLDANGRLGIGATAPVAKLHIEGGSANWNETTPGTSAGTIHLDPGVTTNNFGNAITFGASDTGNGETAQAGIYVRSDDTFGTRMYFATSDDYGLGSKTRMHIGGSGNVGIGTASPQYKLHVSGGISLFNSSTAGSDGNSGIRIVSPTSTAHYNWMLAAQQNVDAGFEITPSTAVGGATFTSPAVVVKATGNVGIGTTSPGTLLDISGTNPTARVLGTSGTTPKLTLSSAGVSAWSFRTSGSDSSFRLDQDGTDRITVLNGGNVGIGTTSPAYKLDVNGTANVNGAFSAVTKSFLINHPLKKNYKLQYGSLESPYHGIRLTGNGVLINGVCEIELPDYISALVKENDVSIQLTNHQHNKIIWVEKIDIENNKFIVKTKKNWFSKKQYKFFWSFTAVRKDVPEMEVEFEVKGDK